VALGVVSMGKRPDLLVDAAALAGCRLAFVGPCPDVLQEVIRDRAATRDVTDRVEVLGAVDDQAWWGWMDRADVAVQLRDSSGGEMSAAVLDALSAGVPVLTNLASAHDYPEGTVHLLPDAAADAGHLAAALEALLADPAAKDALTAGGQRFAAAHQMEHLAAAVLAAIAPDEAHH
jgi:glycosyltransferase involved in cell wall biosynthesis